MAKKQKGDKITMKEKIKRLFYSNSFHLILLSLSYLLFNLFFLIFPLVIFNNANYAFESSLKLIFIICSIAMSWIGVTLIFILLIRYLIKIKFIRFESETSKQDILKKEAYKLTEYLIEKLEKKRNKENNQ